MNCVKCNIETNGDILCNSCSDEIKKTETKTKAKSIMLTLGLFMGINYFTYILYVMLMIFLLYSLMLPVAYGYLGLLLVNLSILLLIIPYLILKKLDLKIIHLPLYKWLSIIFIAIMMIIYNNLSFEMMYENKTTMEEVRVAREEIVNKIDNVDYKLQVSSQIIKNTPFYTLNTHDNVTLNLYDVGNQVYISYSKEKNEIIFPLKKIEKVDVYLHYPNMYELKNDINTFMLYRDVSQDNAVLNISGQKDFYILSKNLEYENLNGEIVKLYNVTGAILKDLITEFVTVNEAKKVSQDVPYYTLEKATTQQIGVIKLPEIEKMGIQYNLSCSVKGSRWNSGTSFDIGNIQNLKENEFIYIPEKDLEKLFITQSYNVVDFYLTTYDDDKYVRCSNIIQLTKEDYENKIW